MLTIAATLVGAAWGGLLARKKGGNQLDMMQYAAGFAVAFGLVALIFTIVLTRFLKP